MEIREKLKQIIEEAQKAAIAAGELPEGEYAPVQRLEIPKESSVIIPPMLLCSGQEPHIALRE